MKNERLLSEDVLEKVVDYEWHCGCGQSGLRLSITKKGSIQGHCFSCGMTFFINDPQIFRFKNPLSFFKTETPVIKGMKGGGTTEWYPRSRVRVFYPKKSRG